MSMIFLLDSCGNSMISLLDFYVIAMGLPWDFYCIPVGFPWDACEVSMGLLWGFYDVSMKLFWTLRVISMNFLLYLHVQTMLGQWFLLKNNGFKPIPVTKHCKYQYVEPFLEQKSLPHEGLHFWSKNHSPMRGWSVSFLVGLVLHRIYFKNIFKNGKIRGWDHWLISFGLVSYVQNKWGMESLWCSMFFSISLKDGDLSLIDDVFFEKMILKNIWEVDTLYVLTNSGLFMV